MVVPESHPDFPKLENEVLGWWRKQDVVRQYLTRNQNSSRKFSFLDGPITANNPMGVHHAHGRTIKDFYQRYKNMLGYKQRFQNGFDCQGLWVEVEEEKDLGFNSKSDIESFGLEKFSRSCRARVERYSQVQTKQSERLGMFMDWSNSYFTMSEANNLHIWHFLKKVDEKGWLYKGRDAMPWCTRCGTAISHHELSDGGYKDVTHRSVYVKFPLSAPDHTALLVWTTTPWTLLSNVAVAVHPQLRYANWELSDGSHIITIHPDEITQKANRQALKNVLGDAHLVQEVRGQELLNQKYQSPFGHLPIFNSIRNSDQILHQVVPAPNLVNPNEGTGAIHIATGAGKEDFDLAKELSLALVESVDEFGNYLDGFGDYTQHNVFEVRDRILRELDQAHLLYAQRDILHAYPHCWRCKHELIFRTTTEWFIRADEIRPLMKSAAGTANWMPPYTQKRMQDWLDNMGNWPISRKRYWGLALPFFESADAQEYYVVGSKEELRRLALQPELVDRLTELHRPWIDEIKIRSPQSGNLLTRVKDVGDCWLDAGIVPFSTVGYLTNRSEWQEWYPFEFISEYTAQIKLWFYATLFMSATLENQAPWKNVLATGFLVDEQGAAMHKSRGNAIPFDDAAEKAGADAIRWLYLRERSANYHGTGNLRFGYNVLDDVRRRFFVIFWNVYRFVVQNSIADGWDSQQWAPGHTSLSLLDQWVISRLHQVIKISQESIDRYDSTNAAQILESFIVKDLSQWYIRRSRERCGPTATSGRDKEDFYQTAYSTLLTLVSALAPFVPFLTEIMYRNLRTNTMPESVHLTNWPRSDSSRINPTLEDEMAQIRLAAEEIHSLRKTEGVPLRQPISLATVSTVQPSKQYAGLVDLLIAEINTRNIEFGTHATIDTTVTDEIRQAGQLREITRKIQSLRGRAGYELSQQIRISIQTNNHEIEKLIQNHLDRLQGKLLADSIAVGHSVPTEFEINSSDIKEEIEIDGQILNVSLQKI